MSLLSLTFPGSSRLCRWMTLRSLFSATRIRTRIIALITALTAATLGASVAVADQVPGGGPDENPAQAQPIAPNTLVSGAFQGSNDYYDYYSFTPQAGQTMTFTLTDTTSSCSGARDPDLDGCPVYGWLADASDQQLGGSGSGAGGNTSVGSNGAYPQQASWSWTFGQTGTYYVGLQDDADPAIPAGTPSYTIEITPISSGTTLHHRTLSLSVKRGNSSLIFHGQLGEDNGFRPCTGDQPVEIEKRSGTSWLTIAHTTTGSSEPQGPANYSVGGSAKPGTYRAVAPQTMAGSANTCEPTGSESVAVNTAKHRRSAELQSVRQGGSHAHLVGYVSADHFDRCAAHVPVIAQRLMGRRWIKVGSGRTGSPNPLGRAAFNISVPLRSGTYRALIPVHQADPLDECLKAISNSKAGPPGH